MDSILALSDLNSKRSIGLIGFALFITSWGTLNAQSNEPNVEPSYLSMACDQLVLQQWRNRDKANTQDLCAGDRLLKWDGQDLSDNDDLVRHWLSKSAGSQSIVTVERETDADPASPKERLEVALTHQGPSHFYSDMDGPRKSFRSAAEIHPEWESYELPLENAIRTQMGDSANEPLAALHAAFSRFTDSVTGHYRNDECVYLMNRPFHAEVWARDLIAPLSHADEPQQMVQLAWRLAEPQGQAFPELPETAALTAESDFAETVAHLETRLHQIDQAVAKALESLTDQERQQLIDWCRDFRPVWKGSNAWDPLVAGFQITKKVDPEALAVSIALSGELLRDIAPDGAIHQALIRSAESAAVGPAGERTHILGIGADQHAVTTSIVIDLGGNDIYTFPTPPAGDTAYRSRVLIDLGGNDIYIDRGAGIASAILSTGLHVDAAGDDQYMGDSKSLGFGLMGLGVLWDQGGHDVYESKVFSQGAASLGIGLLVDRSGNDRYHADAYAQGIGLPAGLGAILDRAGDDVYCGTGAQASPYGDEGEYEGWCQGCGWGFRGAASGGIGLLADNQGKDVYRAGQFGLGCGYFYGVGVVHDQEGDDLYECSRYGLGTAAHYAVGLVFDDAGDDHYLAQRRSAVAEMGSGWDLAVAVLIDGSGNDVYSAKTYALGGAAQNAWGLFQDKGGRDVYRSAGGSPGEALGYLGGATYGGGRLAGNVALFLDEGQETDQYLVPGRSNQASGVDGETAIWIDH